MLWRKILPVFLLFFLLPSSVHAAFSFNISADGPLTVSGLNQEISVSFNISGLPSPSYFRVAFQKAAGDSYFGQIKNNTGDWVDITALSGDCHGYYYVSDTSVTTLIIPLRIGANINPDPGTYLIRAHRFTQSACSSTEAQNSLTADFDFPTPTPTPLPTPLPSPTPKPPTSTPRPPTAVPTMKPVPPTSKPAPTFPNPTAVISNRPTEIPSPVFTVDFMPISTRSGQVLSDESSAGGTVNLIIDSTSEKPGISSRPGAELIVGGGLFLLVSAFLLIKKSGKISI
jgi:hypothetical protein